METVVSVVLTGDFPVYSTGRLWKLVIFTRFQSEVEDRSSGWNWSPQQAESLAAAVRPV